ncbi:hypothetical protein CFP71_33445 [Amycolatopsis thailandensis]|uniref:Uncharacterized protein n=1 Tax=Amycolatopsis thailandensis TaxID=589330 RepID=A0A229RNB0_9PSEU|nr:hypothetical protein [Amycolatopsis thailandensis]OXM48140.1 hypothetical protein CFP71_33445 [Amycolatopsis thailandensis]
MTAQRTITEEIGEIGVWLMGEFGGRVPAAVISRVLNASRRDLEGRIDPEALGEMFHALCRFRLQRILAEDQRITIRIPRSRPS